MKKKIDAAELFDEIQKINWCGRADLYEQVANAIWMLQDKPRFSVCVVDADNGNMVTPKHIIGASSATEARKIYAMMEPSFYVTDKHDRRRRLETAFFLGAGRWNFGYRIDAKRI